MVGLEGNARRLCPPTRPTTHPGDSPPPKSPGSRQDSNPLEGLPHSRQGASDVEAGGEGAPGIGEGHVDEAYLGTLKAGHQHRHPAIPLDAREGSIWQAGIAELAAD